MRLFLLLVVLLALPCVFAETNRIHVLTVGTESQQGGVAEIALEVRPGTGRVFIDSFPLTQLDTQISARFAREYACRLAQEDCSRLDFLYVIRAPSTIVAGPSAGASMTVLTYATLARLSLAQDTVMTGTVNSGGIIGPVGGTDAKVDAAAARGFTRVLLPIDQFNASASYPIAVVSVSDVEEAIWYYTGKDVRPAYVPVQPPDEYYVTMAAIAESLCLRAEQLERVSTNISNSTTVFLERATAAMATGRYYSAASFCFSANLALRSSLLAERDPEDVALVYQQLQADIAEFEETFPREVHSIADLEVYMIVRERVVDASDVLSQMHPDNLSASRVAYALERFNSAVSWSAFFGVLPSESVLLSDAELRQGCLTKLAEAEERLNYVQYIVDVRLGDTRSELDTAYDYHEEEEWALCVFKASKAKAEANSVISALYTGESMNASVRRRILKAEQVLGQQLAIGNFPILAYSYYEYAKDLEDVFSASLYAEYAIELGGLDIYYPPVESRSVFQYHSRDVLLVLFGVFFGFVAGVYVTAWSVRHLRPGRKPRRKSSK